MQDQEKKPIGFLPTFLIILVGLLMVLIVDGNAWGNLWVVKVIGLGSVVLATTIYFVWRRKVSRAYLVRTGLEWTYGLTLLALFGAWILSPDPRQGLARIAWLLGYLLLFYILTDLIEIGLNEQGIVAGLLAASGFVLFMAALETSAMYLEWWDTIGSWTIMPPAPYRLISLAKHASAMMGFVNLCAPLAVVSFFRRKGFEQVLLAFWLVLYCFVIPFSWSWGGWLGIITWIVVFAFYYFWQQDIVKAWRSEGRKRKFIFSGLSIGFLILTSVVLFIVCVVSRKPYIYDAQVAITYDEIWKTAWQVWQGSPVFGVGPGQFGFGILRTVDSIPPGAWVLHAHSLPLQIMVEFGLIGVVALVSLAVENFRWFWERFWLIGAHQQWSGLAVVAGVLAWVFQMLVDEQTSVAISMTTLVLLLAYFVNLPDEPLRRWPQVSNDFVILPALMLAIGGGWMLWAYQPLEKGNALFQSDEIRFAAQSFEKSMQRDPNLSFYAAQAGYVWGVCGVQEADEVCLVNAHQAFEHSTEIEPDVSLVWANMAVVDWQSERYHDKAISNMQHAAALSPNEASYLLNLGWFYEQEELQELAVSAYRKALEEEPDWAGHPFWQFNDVRQEATAILIGKQEVEQGFWVQAREAIEAGDIYEAELALARAAWMGEPDLAVKVVQSMLAEAQQDRSAAIASYEAVAETVQSSALKNANQFMLTYTVWLNRRNGITEDFVPGYLTLDQDYGQFDALEKLYTMYYEDGRCEEAGEAWQIWQLALHGGAVEEIPQVPTCGK